MEGRKGERGNVCKNETDPINPQVTGGRESSRSKLLKRLTNHALRLAIIPSVIVAAQALEGLTKVVAQEPVSKNPAYTQKGELLSQKPITETIQFIKNENREEVESNPINIQATVERTDANGELIEQLVVVNNDVYETHKAPITENLTPFEEDSEMPFIDRSMAISSDGLVLLGGGEYHFTYGDTAFGLKYKGEKNWNMVTWPFTDTGAIIDISRITDQVYLVNGGNGEGGIRQALVTLTPNNRGVSILQTNIESIVGTNLTMGSAQNLTVSRILTATETFDFYSAGSYNLQSGYIKGSLNYATGFGTATNYITTTLPSGIAYLGYLTGIEQYNDPVSGRSVIELSNPDTQMHYIIDEATNTGTAEYYGGKLNNKGIENYQIDSFHVFSINVMRDVNGNKRTLLGGSYASTLDGSGRAGILDKERDIFYNLSPKNHSGIQKDQNIRAALINGEKGILATISRFGQVLIDEKDNVYYINKNLGVHKPNPTPTPIPTPNLKYKNFLPVVQKN